MYEEILKENKPFRVVERQFRSEKFRVYAAEIRKSLAKSMEAKRFLYNPFFSTPFNHYENKIYLEKKKKTLTCQTMKFQFHPDLYQLNSGKST